MKFLAIALLFSSFAYATNATNSKAGRSSTSNYNSGTSTNSNMESERQDEESEGRDYADRRRHMKKDEDDRKKKNWKKSNPRSGTPGNRSDTGTNTGTTTP